MDGEIDITIPAGRTLTIPAEEATVFYVVASSAAFFVKLKGGRKTEFEAGQGLGDEGGKPLGNINFYNTTGAAITATIYISTRRYTSNSVTVLSGSATAITPTSSAPASAVYVITASDTVEQIAPGSAVYVTSIEFFPGKAVAAGVITANTLGDVYVGRTATLLPYQLATADTDSPIVFIAPPGQKYPLSSFRVRGKAGDGVAYTYTPA